MTPSHRALGIRAVLPGLALIVGVDALALLGLWPGAGDIPLSLVMLLLPWATLIVLRAPPGKFGYTRRQFPRALGWGLVAGGMWRIASLLFNLLALRLGEGLPSWLPTVFSAVIWVPFLEETFYRGYLGRPLVQRLGLWPGLVVQALLFSFHPVHLSQGKLAMLSIFGFGLLAGWLLHRFNSLWAAWGAHALANLLPLLAM